jgi:hypothetical protein
MPVFAGPSFSSSFIFLRETCLLFLLFLYKQKFTTVGASPTVFAKKIVSCIKQLHGKHPARLS